MCNCTSGNLDISGCARPGMIAKISSRPSAARILRQIAVRGLFADVVFLVVAMALGGVEGNAGRAAGALVALVFVGNGLDGFGQRLCHCSLRYARRETTPIASTAFREHVDFDLEYQLSAVAF